MVLALGAAGDKPHTCSIVVGGGRGGGGPAGGGGTSCGSCPGVGGVGLAPWFWAGCPELGDVAVVPLALSRSIVGHVGIAVGPSGFGHGAAAVLCLSGDD